MATRKGIPNRIGATVKENVVAVFNRLGGTHAMAAWAQKNQTDFYRLYARLMPTEMIAEVTIRNADELSDAELASIAAAGRRGDAEPATSETLPH